MNLVSLFFCLNIIKTYKFIHIYSFSYDLDRHRITQARLPFKEKET